MSSPRARACHVLLLALALPATTVAAAFAPQFRDVEKPLHTVIGRFDARDQVEVKFRSDDTLQRSAGGWHAARAGALPALDRLLVDGGPVLDMQPLFDVDLVRTLTAADQPALHQWYRLQLREGVDITGVVDALNAMDAVELAYAAPLPVDPGAGSSSGGLPALPAAWTMATPTFEARQIPALPAAQGGIDAAYARTVPGGDGRGIRVVDVEFGWNWRHEDLTKLRVPGTWIPQGGGMVEQFQDHGTAVMGQMIGDNNGIGVRGLVDGATPHYVNVVGRQSGFNPANAILLAAGRLSAGDVILMEIQVGGPNGCSGYVPGEWVGSVYDAVVSAVRRGIHVVQAAGNGNMNLDNARCFGRSFPRGLPDSGAIMVGAGAHWPSRWCGTRQQPRSRLGFSTYGRRVNVQGVGSCVTTTGYGDIWRATNATYTGTFSGTSSSSPIVASAVIALSGIAKARGITLTPARMRQLLIETGSAQVGANGHIGPLPNLRAAVGQLQATALAAQP
ncbi:S8 family serine peptidase [Stenotrophomonas sp. C3(2023)]|uniref:S8 family serine peptidase n=1 Tax=Stenotrophomonas sp. C3(2023) TaxID=3080277 RepID=UPI00293CBE9D|nr:S8 family serine peptidase [Stenotrophomonas sp. C3(2023)]MDV3468494.1 S8 family serine peptidase [Stenotrophomonas sp. C3(2023)]